MLKRSIVSVLTAAPQDSRLGSMLARLKSCHFEVLLSAIMASCVLMIYAAQIDLGHWQTDEFRYFYDHQVLGWAAYFARFEVSPRPFSELLIYIYGSVVLAFDSDYIRETLLTLWSASLLAILLAVWAVLRRSPARVAAAVSLGLAPMAFVMQTNPVTELFYWPAATVAYLPALAAASSLVFLLGDALTSKRRLWCGVALFVAATSHEMGAALAIGFAMVNCLFVIADRKWGARTSGNRGISAALWWLIPALCGLAVMLGLVFFRSAFVDLGSDSKPFTGRLLASAGMACWALLLDIFSTGNSDLSLGGVVLAIVQKTLFVSGFALILLKYGRVQPGRGYLALGFGLAVSAFFSIFAAYYHYGDLCCERQATARHWLINLLLILIAGTILSRWSSDRTPPGLPLGGRRERHSGTEYGLGGPWGPILLVASMLPIMLQIPGIKADVQMLAMARQGRARTWSSGRALGTGQMQFYMPPDNVDMLIRGTSVLVGTFNLTKPLPANFDPEDTALVGAIGRFFGKTIITTCEAWQTDRSFLIDGRFIPACPPHDGPPDIVIGTVAPRS